VPYVMIAPTLSERALVRAGTKGPLAASVQVLACGMGSTAATALSHRLETLVHSLQGLALIGWAGGLRPDLAPGDIVLADHALDEQRGSVPCTVLDLPEAKIGTLLTVSAPLITAQAKRAARTGAIFANKPLAVEMEAYPLALWARQLQVPFVHVRVILDAANETLPDLGETLDPMGRIRPGRLALRLLQRPWLSAPLLRLGIRVQRLGPVLTRVARHVAQAWQSEPSG
jgi:hypothetical protein